MTTRRWQTLKELNDATPDHDYGSTVDNLEHLYRVSSQLACWHEERVSVGQIDEGQLADDSDDAEGENKIADIQDALHNGHELPSVVLVHHEHVKQPYVLIEGRHRYNAAHREKSPSMAAWVAHVGCCGGPAPDVH
jgi:hypothetical protein